MSRRNLTGFIIAFFSLVANAQTPANNLQMILQLFDHAACRVAEQLPHDGITAIFVSAPSSGQPEERFFYSRLVTILSDTFSAPVVVAPVDSLTTLALTYRLHRCEIVYRPLSDQRFLRRTRWQRTASVFLEVGAHNLATRGFHFQKIWHETAADTLDEKSLQQLEDPTLSFTSGRRERNENGFHWLEAALITSATGVIVYLFYSLRSR